MNLPVKFAAQKQNKMKHGGYSTNNNNNNNNNKCDVRGMVKTIKVGGTQPKTRPAPEHAKIVIIETFKITTFGAKRLCKSLSKHLLVKQSH